MRIIKIFILSLVLFYIIIPNIYYRILSGKIIKKASSNGKSIILTFDDGPDPKYTPELLNVLRENNVKCTFFVLAEKAKKYPDLIKEISNEGHYIGLHSLKHSNAIFRSPIQTKKDISESIEILTNLGIKVDYHRPPWGMFNPFTFYYAKKHNIKVVLWSIHAFDWSKWVTVDYIQQKLINKVKPGDIILLHDSRGAKNAPKKTIKALESIIPILKNNGYNFILAKNLDESK